MKNKEPRICVILLTHNDSKRAIEVVTQLKNQTFSEFSVLVIDDNSSYQELQLLETIKCDNVQIHSLPSPYKFGFDFKWNIALKLAFSMNPKYIYYIHTDMKINNVQLLECLYNEMEKEPKLGGVGPTIYNKDGIKSWGEDITKIRMGKKYILNETFMIRTKCYKQMGLIPEKLIYYGNEFFTFNWLRDNDYLVKVMNNVSVTHFAGTGVSISFQNEKDYYRPRTSILIMKLFCKEDSLIQKMRYFNSEINEPKIKIKKNLRKYKFLKVFKTLFFLFIGTLAGLFIQIKLNPPIKSDSY